jgi:nucleoside-diphosphate-sugar epimerase
MRLLITGAQGYVGSRVANLLAARGHQVTALVRSPRESPPNEPHTLVGDLDRPNEIAARVAEYDGIGHFAAAQSPVFGAINARFVDAVLRRLSRGQVLAMQSGSLVFGSSEKQIIDESAPPAPPPFLLERASLERSVIQAGVSGPRTLIVYAAMVHGGRGAMIPATLVEGSRRMGRVVFPGNGEQSWSTVHVDDWARLIVAAVEAKSSGGERFFAAGPVVSIRKLSQYCANALQLPAPTPATDAEVAAIYGPLGAALGLDQRLSAEKANRLFGWTAANNDLQRSFGELI